MISDDQIRKDFPMLTSSMHNHSLIYFDNAATTFKPQIVIDAIANFYSKGYGTVHRAIYELSQKATSSYHHVREKVQRFIGASSYQEIIFTSGTTDGLNLVAHSFCEAFISPGDEILISPFEHHSNLVPWQIVSKKYKAQLKFIPILESGEIDLPQLEKMLNPKVKLISFVHVSNITGFVHPVKEIIKKIRQKSDAKVLVDGAQAIAHMPVDMQDLDADFYVFSAHKMYGPTGLGILYGKEKLLNQMPPLKGGGDMIETVHLSESTYNQLPYKFEAGTPNIAAVIGFGAAISYLKDLGFETIEKKEHALLEYALKKLKAIPKVHLFLPKIYPQASLISFKVEGIHNLDLASLLNFKGVALRSGHLCAQPALSHLKESSLLRVSFSFYNSFVEIDQMFDFLNQAIAKLS